MELPEALTKCDERLLRDLLQLGPAHPRTRDHNDAEDVWYYLMTYSFVEPKPYLERATTLRKNDSKQQGHTISSSGRELLKYLNERLSQNN
jgi:hypothetical protein